MSGQVFCYITSSSPGPVSSHLWHFLCCHSNSDAGVPGQRQTQKRTIPWELLAESFSAGSTPGMGWYHPSQHGCPTSMHHPATFPHAHVHWGAIWVQRRVLSIWGFLCCCALPQPAPAALTFAHGTLPIPLTIRTKGTILTWSVLA